METPWWKKPFIWISAILGILFTLLMGQKRRAEKAEGEVEAAKAREKDAGLAEREASISEAERKAQEELERLKREQPDAPPMDPDKVKKYWEDQ